MTNKESSVLDIWEEYNFKIIDAQDGIIGDHEITINELERRALKKEEQIDNSWYNKELDEKMEVDNFYYWDYVKYLGPDDDIEAADYEKIGKGFML